MQLFKNLLSGIRNENIINALKQQHKADRILIDRLQEDKNHFMGICELQGLDIEKLEYDLKIMTNNYRYQKNKAVPLWKDKYYKLKKQNGKLN